MIHFFFVVLLLSAENTAAMASALVATLAGGDVWEAVQNCYEMFDKGGYFYNKVMNDLGQLKPNQHCTLSFFPNKVSDFKL